MVGKAYQNIADEAAHAYHRGQHRLAATKYLQAFRACPDRWGYLRWQIFHGFTSILQEEYFQASMERDIEPLMDIVHDKNELKLYRIEAAFTTGLLFWLRGNREEAADYYREAIRLAGKVPKQELRHRVLSSIVSPDGMRPMGVGPRRMEELIPSIVADCKTNIEGMTGSMFDRMMPPPPQRLRSDGTPMPESYRFTGVPMESMMEADEDWIPEEFKQLVRIGGEKCDCCGKTPEDLGLENLLKCGNCGKAYYCGRQCQRKQWKAGHKMCCRKPGEFQSGDYIRLHGFEILPKTLLKLGVTNGTLAQVVREHPDSKGRWKVRAHGGIELLIGSKNMEQLRPVK